MAAFQQPPPPRSRPLRPRTTHHAPLTAFCLRQPSRARLHPGFPEGSSIAPQLLRGGRRKWLLQHHTSYIPASTQPPWL
ncbi:hypothetical protein N7516_008911 [Penicillium verrucosum]|uniref:uncharacterized protein n=1 Tax=Penicillium verrucosum TaxID=60171 RepID=UPI002544E2E4|nr:uncharacterized protein N7516_008911 [Penicillium verrucosum]KAJ5927138.1 hypothetical protein N7516_008911 [Penicillium verrucosum]